MDAAQLTVVGLGPGDPGLVTVSGAQALREANIVFVPRRRTEQQSLALDICKAYLEAGRQEIVTLPLVMEREQVEAAAAWDAAAATIAERVQPGVRAVYALLGDPMLYGSFTPLHERITALRPDVVLRFLPGVTSFSAAAAAISTPLVAEDERLAILPGVYEDDPAQLAQTLANFDTVAVLKAGRSIPALIKALEAQPEQHDIWLAERLGMPGERIAAGHEQVAHAESGYFSLALIKRAPRAVVEAEGERRAGKVVFVGAGPGAPDLVTLRGKQAIAAADAVFYADSLVMEAVTRWARPGAEIVPTSGMHLDDILHAMRTVVARGGSVARVHSGDPSLYGATHEQMRALEAEGIPFEVVPGVTVAFAAAAKLHAELTVPEVTQTIILTRVSGRASPVPDAESLRSLAGHGASLAIYLAATKAHQVQADLIAGGYPPTTRVAICYRVDWPDEQIVRCQLHELAEQVRAHGFTRQTLILVSPALNAGEARSRLYDAGYVHRFRNQRVQQAQPAPASVPARTTARSKPAMIAVTRAGSDLAQNLAQQLGGVAYVPERFHMQDVGKAEPYKGGVIELIRGLWSQQQAFVLIMATGIAVRAVGPLAVDKRHDPAVVVCDETGKAVISLLSGHLGGANQLTQRIAAQTGGQAILTTASEVQHLPALDLLGCDRSWRIAPGSALTRAMAALVNGEALALHDPLELLAGMPLPPHVERVSAASLTDPRWAATLVVSDAKAEQRWLERGVVYHPPTIAAGIGCRRNTSPRAIAAAVQAACDEAGIAIESVAVVGTAQLKAEEPGLLAFVEQHGLPLQVYTDDEIRSVDPAALASPSAATERFDLPGVAEPCALLAAGTDRLLQPKRVHDGVTVALARRERRDG